MQASEILFKRLTALLTKSPRLIFALQAVLCALLLMSTLSRAVENTATGLVDRPVSLKQYLIPVSPPVSITKSASGSQNENWYQLNLSLPESIYPNWLLAFRRTPHQQLDVFIPTGNGFRLSSIGSKANNKGSDPRTTLLNIERGRVQTLYLRVNTPLPNRLQPELWPQPLYTLEEYKVRNLISSLQSLLILFLSAAAIITFISRQQNYLLLTCHLLATTTLLIMWQGDIFRSFSWLGDPGTWVLVMVGISLISALSCYNNLALLSRHSPASNRIILWLNLCAAGVIISFGFTNNTETLLLDIGFALLGIIAFILAANLLYTASIGENTAKFVLPLISVLSLALYALWQQSSWPRSTPTLNEIGLISLQSLLITGLYWINRKQTDQRAISVNRVLTFNGQRRVFDSALRQHMYAPASKPLSENNIRKRVLETLDSIVPGVPSLLITRKDHKWSINSYYPNFTQEIKQHMSYLNQEFISIIKSGGEHQININNKNNPSYWVFLLHSNNNHHTLLVVSPGRLNNKSTKWQELLDITSHARTLFQANEQSRYWKLQASIDPLTNTLNRRAFLTEAKKLISEDQVAMKQSCLLFIDLDNFKQINDQYGHPAGDKVLSSAASQLRNTLRQKDLLARYGGEEFIVLLPATEAVQGVKIAERLRTAISRVNITPGTITASLGISATISENHSLDTLINEADQALYKAKSNGKNQLVRAHSCRDLRLFDTLFDSTSSKP